jgi:hypothetical protein
MTEISAIAYKIYLHGPLSDVKVHNALKRLGQEKGLVIRSFLTPIPIKDWDDCYSIMVYSTDPDYRKLRKLIDKYGLKLFGCKLFLYFKAIASTYNGLPRLAYDFFSTFDCTRQKVYLQPSARKNIFPTREKDRMDVETGLMDRPKHNPDLEGFYHASRGTTTLEHFCTLIHAFLDVLKERNIFALDLERVTIKEEQVHEVEFKWGEPRKEDSIIERRLYDFDPDKRNPKWEEEELIMETFGTYLATYLTPVVRSDAFVWDNDLDGVVYIEVERKWRNCLMKIEKYSGFVGNKPYHLIFYIPKKAQGKHKTILEESKLKDVEVRYYDYDPGSEMVVKTLGKGYMKGWFMGYA